VPEPSAAPDGLSNDRLVLRPLRDSDLGLGRLISPIDTENTPSRAVARRIGMNHERDLVFEGRATSLFALEKRCQAPVFQGGA
jgi:RimJ/RimL family protein N-acetyltransferase